jgi:hypothetical protein
MIFGTGIGPDSIVPLDPGPVPDQGKQSRLQKNLKKEKFHV